MRTDFTKGQELKAGRFLKRDILLYTFISGAVMLWFVFLIITSMNAADSESPDDDAGMRLTEQQLMLLFSVATVGEVCLIFLRYRTWARLVKGGVEVPGTIVGIRNTSQGSWVMVSYTFEGEEITTNKSFGGLLPKLGKRLEEGQSVSLLVNSKKPGRYLILDLYMDPLP